MYIISCTKNGIKFISQLVSEEACNRILGQLKRYGYTKICAKRIPLNEKHKYTRPELIYVR